MFIKKQRTLSILFAIVLLFGAIVITPINAFAESPDSAANTQVEGTDGTPDGIQEEDSDGSSDEDEVQKEDSDGSSGEDQGEGSDGSSDEDEVQEEDSDGSSDSDQEEDNNEALDEVQDEDADGSSDEISDADIEEEIPEDIPDENTDIISEKTINKVIKSNAKQASGLSITVEYPEQIRCGTPTTFTVNAEGGSGEYQYRIHSIMTSEHVSVYDVSWGSNSAYQDSNEFSFTFYASGTYYVRFSVRDKNTNEFKSTGLYEYKLDIQDPQCPSVEQIVENTVAECMQSCTTDFEKAVWLHDWILDHADYDNSFSYCSAEGVLARGLGTCESYHKAYVMLLNKAGIATGRIEGNGHVWTAVRMDGQWYQVDSTWDDMGANYKGTYYEHMYFGLTDNIMGLVHSDHSSATPGYESTSLENNYFIKTGMIRQWSDPFVESINQNIADGKTEFSLPVTNSMPDNYKNVIYNLVAYQLSNQSWGSMEISASYKDSVITVTVQEEKKSDNVYNGIDYSAVYDYTYYISKHPDLKKAFGDDKYKALKHFVNTGMSEGRQAKDSFNVYSYMNRYSDLRNAYGNNLKKYYLHYMNRGLIEGRDGRDGSNSTTQPTGSETVYNGIDYSAVYDYTYYISKHADVKKAFGDDKYKALQHFVNTGMSEGRQAKESFNVHSYMNRYADLRSTYGNNLKKYYLHYMNRGLIEGRDGRDGSNSTTQPTGSETIYNGIDYSAVYDYTYYISKHADVKKAFGSDKYKALQHFVNSGMSEGRQAKDSFNVYSYKNRYSDLRDAFGNNLKKYYLHYMNNGLKEGRSGS